MKAFSHRLEYALVRLADAFFQWLPRPLALSMGEGLGTLLSFILAKRNRLILENLTHAFPQKTAEQKEAIARSVWKNIGRTAVEFVRSTEVYQPPLDRWVEWTGAEHMEKAIAGGKGVILLAAHMTNWEFNGIFIQLRFGIMTAIARPMKNPLVESWLQNKRSSTAMQIILHRNAVKASLKCLKDKKIIGILVDQNLYTGGVFVDFFGRPAATTTLPALLHIRTGAPVLITYNVREGDRFRVFLTPPLKFPVVADDSKRVEAYTQEISRQFENIIRERPENWFWIHNRWKRKPE